MVRIWLFRIVLLLACVISLCSPAYAATLSVSLGELNDAIEQMDSAPDSVQQLVLQKISDQLLEADLRLDAGELLFSDTASDLVSSSSCNRTEVRSLTTNVVLASDTSLSLSLLSLNDPVSIQLDLNTRIEAFGQAKQIVGFRLGGCQQLATDSFSFAASGDAQFSLRLTLLLNPVLNTVSEQLVLSPELSLDASLVRSNSRVDVDDSLLRSVLEDLIEDEIDDAFNSSRLNTEVAELEQRLTQRISSELDNGQLVVDLPTPNDEQIDALYALLSPQGDFLLSLGYLRTRRLELLAAIILGDDAQIAELTSAAAQCQAAGILQAPLPHKPLYQLADEGGCAAVQLNTSDDSVGGNALFYVDPSCQVTADYRHTNTVDYCQTVLDRQRLGNADASPDQLRSWTLSPGTRFDIGAASVTGLLQPFTQRIAYKRVDTAMGECALEMRIHAPQPVDTYNRSTTDGAFTSDSVDQTTPARALIAFHGGSWQRRSSGALGIEAMASQFVNRGFVVFAPFYRLIGDAEGTQACNNASLDDVLEDASDALTWVLQNARHFGAEGKPALFGQSAGGHMAAVLAVERPTEIASAALFYAPTDFSDFANQLINQQIDTETGQRILETVVGETLETLDFGSELIVRNSLPLRIGIDAIANPPKPIPPMFMLHGLQDTVLPVNQSIRLCNALAGEALDREIPVNGLRRVTNCGDQGSELHLIAEGEHALDLCIAEELCLAGSPASALLTANSVEQMLSWIVEARTPELDTLSSTEISAVDDATENSTGSFSDDASPTVVEGSSGGSMYLLVLPLAILTWRRKKDTGWMIVDRSQG